jgi:hypothetical protein
MRRLWAIMVVSAALTLCGGVTERVADAKGKAKAAAGAGPSTKKEVNACGCYKDTAGACFCGKKGKCSCPGDCEPKGCEDKRAKQMQKEIAAETKKAHDADKKARASEKAGKGSKAAKPKASP